MADFRFGTLASSPDGKQKVMSRNIAAVLIATLLLASCGPLRRLPPVPQSQQQAISGRGPKAVRYGVDEVTPQMIENGIAAYQREQAYAASTGHTGPLPPAY